MRRAPLCSDTGDTCREQFRPNCRADSDGPALQPFNVIMTKLRAGSRIVDRQQTIGRANTLPVRDHYSTCVRRLLCGCQSALTPAHKPIRSLHDT